MWWTTTKAPKDLFRRPSYQTPELEVVIRASLGVDPSIIAQRVGLSAPLVSAYQRNLV